MRFLLLASSIFTARAVAFVHPPHGLFAGFRAALPRSATSDPPGGEGLLPPRDETFNPLAVLRELNAAPDVLPGSERYDRVGRLSGGIWKSLVIGFIPSTVRVLF